MAEWFKLAVNTETLVLQNSSTGNHGADYVRHRQRCPVQQLLMLFPKWHVLNQMRAGDET